MEILRNRATMFLIIMILSVAFIGGVNNTNLEDNNEPDVAVNA